MQRGNTEEKQAGTGCKGGIKIYISWARRGGVRKAKAEMQLRFTRTSQAKRIVSTTTLAVKS